MKTKIVYIVTSSGTDVYVEMTYMSIWSCRFHNRDAEIILISDVDSLPHIYRYPELSDIVSQIITLPFDENTSKVHRARILNIQMRNLVKGDFLYIDSDTIVCDSLKEIDNCPYQLAMVEDLHASSLYKAPHRRLMVSTIVSAFDILPKFRSKYYNSGVIFAKDNIETHAFFDEWLDNYIELYNRTGSTFDQTSLFLTTYKHPNFVSSLNNGFNAQIALNCKFLETGKILHFFISLKESVCWHPFINENYFAEIKNTGLLSEKIKFDILNCKNLYNGSHLCKKFKWIPKILTDTSQKAYILLKFKVFSFPTYIFYKILFKLHKFKACNI